ncbi:MAG: A/G-specific adenine glycosylase [Bacteroidales bacterium]|jgi:A/G-specific adenine glycosylase|nr:A/G-specific adenine glycosylase [Bacteroidales bacterium]
MHFTQLLLQWYAENQRQLPWRGETDPYKIWISEIILQQTRVVQGYDYYKRFIERFPTVKVLAQASEEEVLKIWQGLGYYSRARHIHHAAQTIMTQFQGKFPSQYKDIRTLKGVGDYTAAAIASMAFQLVYPAIDGNALRVISRFFGVIEDVGMPKTVKEITAISENQIDKEHPDLYNQAIMDFGSSVCTPKNPDCENCPLQRGCYAFAHQLSTKLPLKENRVKIKERWFHYFIITNNNKTIVQQRAAKDIWRGLYEFPLWESERQEEEETVLAWLSQHYPGRINSGHLTQQTTSKLTHRIIYAHFYVIETDSLVKMTENQQIIPIIQLPTLPFPKSIAQFLHF